MLRQDLRKEMRRWVVLKISRRIIAETLREYERTKVPEVLRHASQSLELITGGRYVRVQSRESRELKILHS